MTTRVTAQPPPDEHLLLCPRCNSSHFVPYSAPPHVTRLAAGLGVYPPALSRADNETDICSHCGTEEALIVFSGNNPSSPADWPLLP